MKAIQEGVGYVCHQAIHSNSILEMSSTAGRHRMEALQVTIAVYKEIYLGSCTEHRMLG